MKKTLKATELRIGNWVSSKEIPVQIEEITTETVRYCFGDFPINYIRPIPLTAEYLMRFGFECRIVHEHKAWGFDKIYIWENNKGKFEWSVGLPIKSIHQLQNLFFALTGYELKLKEGDCL